MEPDYSNLSTEQLLKMRDKASGQNVEPDYSQIPTETLIKMREQVPDNTPSDSPYDAVLGVINNIPAVRAFQYVKEGDVDPRFKDIPGFTGKGLPLIGGGRSQIERGKVTTLSDKGFGNVVKNALGDRLLKSENDKFGQEIITYRGDDGQPIQTYINKPGLDGQDVDRFISSAVPFVVAGGVAAKLGQALKAGLAGRTALQGGAAMGVDAINQNLADYDMDQADREEFNYGRMGAAALGGAGGEVLGTLLTRLVAGHGLIDKTTGKLTEKGKQWARSNKVDPDALEPEVAAYLGQKIERAADSEELAIQARTMEFDIPTTKAQRTKNYDDAYTELLIEKGQRGADAENIYKNFKKEQTEAIENAALNKVGNKIARDAAGTDLVPLGDNIREGLKRGVNQYKRAEKIKWSNIGPMFPEDEAFDSLPDFINRKAEQAGLQLLPHGTEASAKMQQTMQAYMNGDLKSSGLEILSRRANDNIVPKKGILGDFLQGVEKRSITPASDLFENYNQFRLKNGLNSLSNDEISKEFSQIGLKPFRQARKVRYDLSKYQGGRDLNPGNVFSIDQARRELLRLKDTAQPGSPDARLANHLYEGFNEWIDDAAEKALIVADDPGAHMALKSARAFTRKVKRILQPTDNRRKLTPAARKITQVLETADSPEGVVSALFGRQTGGKQMPEGSTQALKHLKIALLKNGENAAFDSVKMAYWTKLAMDNKGNVLSPAKLRTNIEEAFKKQKTAMNILLDPSEQALIKRFSASLKDLHVDHPNPSLSSVGVAHNTRKAVKGTLNSLQQRMRLVKGQIFKANLLSFAAKYLDTPLINTGAMLGRRHVGQNLNVRSRNKFGMLGGIGAEVNAMDYSE